MLDELGALLSLVATYYFIRLDQKAWAISLAATSLNAWLYLEKGIYADMFLELFYFGSSCYGWLFWGKPASTNQQNSFYLAKKQIWMLALFILFFFTITEQALSIFTASTVAAVDALTTTLSLAAQWLMCRKKIATWILWFFTDSLFAFLYLQKQLPWHALLMLIYTIMAVCGYLSWRKQQEPIIACS